MVSTGGVDDFRNEPCKTLSMTPTSLQHFDTFRQVRLMQARQVFKYPTGYALILPYYGLGHLYSVTADKTFDLATKIEATRQILDGLRALHDLLRIHRDIKPDNILVQSLQPLNLVIGDFGQISFSGGISMVGTVWFRAPEIMHYAPIKRPHTTAVDIYSVGMMILWLIGPDVGGLSISDDIIWTEKDWVETVGSKIAIAISRHPTGVLNDSLAMAQSLVQWDPEERPSAAACLQFPWIKPGATVNQINTNAPHRNPQIQQEAKSIIRRSSRLRRQAEASRHQRSDPMDIDDI